MNVACKPVPNPGHIVFVGFMGAGKTTVAKKLARMFAWRWVDLDDVVTAHAAKPVTRIFSDEGEAGFRARESAALESLLDETPLMVSCGGGVVLAERNRLLLPKLGCVVYLDVDAEEALRRIDDTTSRPVLAGARSVVEVLTSRRPLYEEVATITIHTTDHTIGEVVDSCGASLHERGLL